MPDYDKPLVDDPLLGICINPEKMETDKLYYMKYDNETYVAKKFANGHIAIGIKDD